MDAVCDCLDEDMHFAVGEVSADAPPGLVRNSSWVERGLGTRIVTRIPRGRKWWGRPSGGARLHRDARASTMRALPPAIFLNPDTRLRSARAIHVARCARETTEPKNTNSNMS